jgi:hypothetical protein
MDNIPGQVFEALERNVANAYQVVPQKKKGPPQSTTGSIRSREPALRRGRHMQLPRPAMEINVRLVDTAMREERVGFNLKPGLGMTCQLFPQTIFSFQ